MSIHEIYNNVAGMHHQRRMSFEEFNKAILAVFEKAVSIKPEQLHIWYLEATKKLSPDSYNEKAQVDYEFLSNEQQYIDEYIADKIKDDIKAKLHSEGL